MAITPIEYGKNLRPSVVTNIKKINELVAVVNEIDPDSMSGLKDDVNSLKSNMSQAQADILSNKTSINEMSSTLATALQDISKIKTTLYTPLEETE